MKDYKIKCKDCGKDFVITVDDQKWYIERNLTLPKRCKDCRRINREKAKKYGG